MCWVCFSVVMSIPNELNTDYERAVTLAASSDDAGFSEADLRDKLGWSSDRCERVIRALLNDGMVWEDRQDPRAQVMYVFPGMSAVGAGGES
jgi:hypothetical protein